MKAGMIPNRDARSSTDVDPTRGYCGGMTDALARLANGRRGPATEADRPPPSVFPATPASRAAMRLARRRDT